MSDALPHIYQIPVEVLYCAEMHGPWQRRVSTETGHATGTTRYPPRPSLGPQPDGHHGVIAYLPASGCHSTGVGDRVLIRDDDLAAHDFAALDAQPTTWVSILTSLVLPCLFLGDRPRAQWAYDQLLPLADTCVVYGLAFGFGGGVAGYLGALAVAAVAGVEFAFESVESIVARSGDDALRGIEEAHAAAVVHPIDGSGRRYRFAHRVLREAIYQALNPTRRARLHAELPTLVTPPV